MIEWRHREVTEMLKSVEREMSELRKYLIPVIPDPVTPTKKRKIDEIIELSSNWSKRANRGSIVPAAEENDSIDTIECISSDSTHKTDSTDHPGSDSDSPPDDIQVFMV